MSALATKADLPRMIWEVINQNMMEPNISTIGAREVAEYIEREYIAGRMATAWFEGAACRSMGDPTLTNPHIPAGRDPQDFHPKYIHPRYRAVTE